MSVTTPSAGVKRMLTENAALTRAERGGDARQRMAAHADERGRGQRDQHEVAGVRGDARDDPDEDDDVRQQAR